MKKNKILVEQIFEKITSIATMLLGNSITFIFAVCLVSYWWSTNLFSSKDWHQNIGDLIFGITFLSLFIIQKSFNKYSALMHLKLNELISSHETANNAVLNTNKKTESEILELAKEYSDVEIEEILIEKVKNDNA
ncbi:low affinity iron permease family protein [Flavobacterium sp.]|uniref:low affinity iron permease family protein n=1 Tax=Flavobacterium sp. TaxID=239 RepID=UPI0037505F58